MVIGDRVFAVANDGCFTTNAILHAPLVIKIPDNLSFDEAATMAGGFATALQALVDVGQLEKGQVRASAAILWYPSLADVLPDRLDAFGLRWSWSCRNADKQDDWSRGIRNSSCMEGKRSDIRDRFLLPLATKRRYDI